MEFKQLTIRFSDTADEEVRLLVNDLRLAQIAEHLRRPGPITDDLRDALLILFSTLTDMFSAGLPDLEGDPELVLRKISRDINIARLLRERGLFRLYRLVHRKDDNGVLFFMSIINPLTGSPFAKQEEFIGWVCEDAHISRSMTFMRMATIDRTLALGFSLEQSFQLILSKPYVIWETLHIVGQWDKNTLKHIDPSVAVQIARKITPNLAPQIEVLAKAVEADPTRMDELKTAIKPVLANLLLDVAAHDRAKDASAFIKHDVLCLPEIAYSWNLEADYLLIEFTRREIDQATGEEYIAEIKHIPLVPDTDSLPDEVRNDLCKRLPIRNRTEL